MEVNKQLHSVFCSTSADFSRGLNVAVTAAVARAVSVKGVVPDADADIIYPVISEDFEQVAFAVFFIVKLNARLLKRKHGGYVDSADKIGIIEVNFTALCRERRQKCGTDKRKNRQHGRKSLFDHNSPLRITLYNNDNTNTEATSIFFGK